MEERAEEFEYLAKGVRIDQDFLDELNGAVIRQWPEANMKITAICNNAKFTFTGLQDFLSKIGSVQFIIDRLDIEVLRSQETSYYIDGGISLSFSCKQGEPPVTEKICLDKVSEYQSIRESLQSIFKNHRLWYSFLSSTLLMLLIAVALGIAFTIWLLDTDAAIPKSVIFDVYIVLFFIASMSAAPWAGRVKSYLFPKNEIYFGCNKKRIDSAARVRNFIFIVVITGIVIGVISSIISSWILQK